ncbi:metallophosphoesterase family protein [Methanocella sp. MCL-LM]|uniref:metallophosphoesterase family protein n=1 Tax=Methanocella sp. MCL-LM TaxID=3412035 RepID=UPI003C71028D
MRLLCFSDIHGNIAAVKGLIKDVRARRARYDAVVVAGDLTNFSVTRDQQESQKALDTILQLLTAEFDNVWYVPGNRDYVGRGKKRLSLTHYKGMMIEEGKKYYLGPKLPITTTPELSDKNTILIQHSNVVYEGGFKRRSVVYKNALMHIVGHTHTGIVSGNYLNTGFLYRDDSNGAEPMMGGYFEVEITNRAVTYTFIPLGPIKRRDLKCEGFKGSMYSPHGYAFPVKLAAK